MMLRIFLTLVFFVLPMGAHAQVMFSEIAWMGSGDDANNEWIELYNHGATDIDVTGWTIDDGNTFAVTLAGSIPSQTIVLLERTDDSSVPSVSAFQIYTGALGNDGRTLTLKDVSGSNMDQVVGGSNWESIGGNNTNKETPQRTMTGWVTGVATPGAQNVEHDSGNNDEKATTTTENTSTNTVTKKSSGGGSSKKSSAKIVTLESKDTVLELTLNAPTTAYVNQDVMFEVVPTGAGKTILNSLKYEWNFGDTYTADGKAPKHAFAYPGEYIVIVEATFAKRTVLMRHEITVLPLTVTLSRNEKGDIVLHNNAKYEVDISGYHLQGTQNFIFPKNSVLKSSGTLTIAAHRIGATPATTVTIRDGLETLLASTPVSTTAPLPTYVAQYKKPSPTTQLMTAPTAPVAGGQTEELLVQPVTVKTSIDDVSKPILIGSQTLAEESGESATAEKMCSWGFLCRVFSKF